MRRPTIWVSFACCGCRRFADTACQYFNGCVTTGSSTYLRPVQISRLFDVYWYTKSARCIVRSSTPMQITIA
ncbi:uncharacterized protein HD556DRAFT_1409806 [Suillus plorans]|uniref:Uncharacterized protein n=1 Tax=Suillus plorans TaxID=116603 RepID=A0A9P7AFQ1_9AGAM|nr:uncharacterized protein HD556DRAFT_1409806 [Suillus plorans]KAG1787369.1 hypothetical protein HD556DRAFT_1409806 [Suillus plorans]